MPPTRHTSQQPSHPPSSYTPYQGFPPVLERGSACLECRRRKMKCDSGKPICFQCSSHGRHHACQYEDPRHWNQRRRTRHDLRTAHEQLANANMEIQHLRALLSTYHDPSPTTSGHTVGSELVFPTMKPHMALGGGFFFASDFPAPTSQEFFQLDATVPSPDAAFDLILARQPDALTMSSHQGQDPVIHPDLQSATLLLRGLEETPSSQATLLNMFFSHAGQLNFELTQSEFQQRLDGPLYNRPHDALLNVMYLMACSFSKDPSINRHQTKFRQRAQHAVYRCMKRPQDICDCVQACDLLAVYCYINDYPAEVRMHLRVASILGGWVEDVASKKDSPGPGRSANGDIPKPTLSGSGSCGPLETDGGLSAEQMIVLQQAYTIDRLFTTGLDNVAPTFPSNFFLPPGDFLEVPKRKQWPCKQKKGLKKASPILTCINSSQRVALTHKEISALRAAMAEKLWAANHPLTADDGSLSFPGETLDGSPRDLLGELETFKGSLPSIHLPASHPQSDGHYPSNCDRSVLSVHTQACAAILRVTMQKPQTDRPLRDTSRNQIGEILALIKELDDEDYQYLDPIMGLCWQWVVQYLVEETKNPASFHKSRKKVEGAITCVLAAMAKLANEIPIALVNFANVEEGCRACGIDIP